MSKSNTMANHTLGPWHCGGHGGRIIYAADGMPVADACTYCGEDSSVMRANAALIAAAPELLIACKAVLQALEHADLQGSVLWIDPPYQATAVHETAHERLREVIARAATVRDEV